MTPAASNGGRFKVLASRDIAQRLKRIQKQAKQQGRGDEVLAAIRHILRRLTEDPAEFGEPLYGLPALRLEVRHGAVGPLLIHFAVHDVRPLVFIKLVQLLPETAA